MTNKRYFVGSSRKIGESFIDHKTESALKSVEQMLSALSIKAMMPIGVRVTPAHLAIDADRDMMVNEGYSFINAGRGVPDPTPFGAMQAPLNRRLRREGRASLGSSQRIVSYYLDPLKTMSAADGPVAAMVGGQYPRPNYANLIPVDETERAVSEIESKVDAVLGAKPRNIQDAVKKLRSAEKMVNGTNPSGGNFKLDLPYFEVQMQNQLRRLSPRFDGPNTVMTANDLGVYYAIAHQLIHNPEAFNDVHLVLAPTNDPDRYEAQPYNGATSVLPSYVRLRPLSEMDREFVDPDLGEVVGVAQTTARSMTNIERTVDTSSTSGSRIPVVVELPIYKSDEQIDAKFTLRPSQATASAIINQAMTQLINQVGAQQGVPQIRPIQKEYPPPPDHIEETIEQLLKYEASNTISGIEVNPLMDSVSVNVLLPILDAMRNLKSKLDSLVDAQTAPKDAVARQERLAKIRAVEAEIKRLHDLGNQATSLIVGLHEMGHVSDFLGDYRASPAGVAAKANASFGLNSQLELRRDMDALAHFGSAQPHPATDDMAKAFARHFVKKTLVPMLAEEILSNNIPAIEINLNNILSEISALQAPVNAHIPRGRGHGGPVSNWARDFTTANLNQIGLPSGPGSIQDLITGGYFDPNSLSNSAVVSSLADATIAKLEQIADGLLGARNMTGQEFLADLADGELIPIMKLIPDRVNLMRSDSSKAMVKLAIASGILDGFEKAINQALSSVSSMRAARSGSTGNNSFLVPWINSQSIDMTPEAARSGFRNLITDMLRDNPAAVEEFMKLYAANKGKPWLDAQGNFDPVSYLKDLFANPTNPKGVNLLTAMAMVNSWHIAKGSNGWKNLPDSTIDLIRSAVMSLTDYSGPADYDLAFPLPKGELATNRETYAELNPIILMRLESAMSKLSQDERRAVEQLISRMHEFARGLISDMNNSGRIP